MSAAAAQRRAASSPSKASTAPASPRTSRRWPTGRARAAPRWCSRASPAARRWPRRLRELFLHEPMDPLTEALLVFAARRDHLRAGHRAGAGARRDGAVRPLHRRHLRLPGRGPRLRPGGARRSWRPGCRQGRQPDLTLWFDLAPAEAARRRAAVRERRPAGARGRGVLRARARRLCAARARRARALRAHRRRADARGRARRRDRARWRRAAGSRNGRRR